MAYAPLTPLIRHPTKGGPLIPILDRIAKRLSIEPPAALFLWFRAKGIVPVSSSTKPERIAGFGELARSDKTLTADEVKEIDAIGDKYHLRNNTEHFLFDHPQTNLPNGA